MYRVHILGAIVKEIRARRRAGAGLGEIFSYLATVHPGERLLATRYVKEAFCQRADFLMTISADPYNPGAPIDFSSAERAVDSRRSDWEIQPFPELMRPQDYFAFLQAADESKCAIIVCGANPEAGKRIGEPGVRCYGGRAFVTSSTAGPNAGLLTGDPNDTRLQELLAKTALSWENYGDHLARFGISISTPDEGYVLRDVDGFRLHEPYRLHGVYREGSGGEAAWTAREGERLRALINRRLGDELVLFGPHDEWEHRNDPAIAGPYAGPLPPVIEFQSEQRIDNFVDTRRLADSWFYSSRWQQLYPGHPIEN